MSSRIIKNALLGHRLLKMSELSKILNEFNVTDEKFSELEIYGLISNFKAEDLTEDERFIFLAELIAFGLRENYDWSRLGKAGWNTYFGPHAELRNDEGAFQTLPERNQITTEMLKYWTMRAEQVTHPILKARYAGLVWDFYQHEKGIKKQIKMAEILIDSIIEMIEKRQHSFEGDETIKLKNVLNIALATKNKRLNDIKNLILDYEKNHVKNDMAYFAWILPYDELIMNPKIQLSDVEKNGIVQNIEDRLFRLIKSASGRLNEMHAIYEGARRLAQHYKQIGNNEKVRSVLTEYAMVVCQRADIGKPRNAYDWIDNAIQLVKEFNLTSESEKLTLKMQEVCESLIAGMEMISVEYEMDHTDLNGMQNFIEKMTEGDVYTCMRRLAFKFIPRKLYIENQVLDQAIQFPFTNNAMKLIIADRKGRPLSKMGEARHDPEKHHFLMASKYIIFNKSLMRIILNTIFCRHRITANYLTDYLYRSPIFMEDHKEIIREGLQAYLDGKPISALHVLIPQVEEAIRNIVVTIFTQNRKDGGYNEKILDSLLREETVKNKIGEDKIFYLRTILTSQLGLYLRHKICHGMINTAECTMENADLIFHALIILTEMTVTNKINTIGWRFEDAENPYANKWCSSVIIA